MQRRYAALVKCHLQSTQSLAAGIHAVPDVSDSFATTWAAHRFLNNERVTLPALAEPLIEGLRQEAPRVCERFLLVAHDWSQLMYPDHRSKQDRARLSSRGEPDGYELETALAISDRDGSPLAPLAMSLRAADGVHCSRDCQPRQALSPLDELGPAMRSIEELRLPLPAVHIIDAEADSVAHFRQWSGHPNRWYLVRADDRLVEHEGVERKCSALRRTLQEQERFRYQRAVAYHGREASPWIAEARVTLLRAGQRNRPAAGDRKRIRGSALELRLVISEVRDPHGGLLVTWYLLTNLPEEVAAGDVALGYYWRWRIETYFKLLKTAGLNAESWQQQTAPAIARRLLVASMACVTVWRLARSTHPQAAPARQLLVRLSGRQMKRGRESTIPALLAGLWTLWSMIDALNHYSLDEIRELATLCLSIASPSRPP